MKLGNLIFTNKNSPTCIVMSGNKNINIIGKNLRDVLFDLG